MDRIGQCGQNNDCTTGWTGKSNVQAGSSRQSIIFVISVTVPLSLGAPNHLD